MDDLLSSQDTGIWRFSLNHSWTPENAKDVVGYKCDVCSGNFLLSKTEQTLVCPFCGSISLAPRHIIGAFRPDFFVPFEIEKDTAVSIALHSIYNKDFTHKLFSSDNILRHLTPVYLPFWLFDTTVNADFTYTGQKIFPWQSGGFQHTETKYYEVERSGIVCFRRIPILATTLISEALFVCDSPLFSDAAVKSFSELTLKNEFILDYDTTPEASKLKFDYHIKRNTEKLFMDTLSDYDAISPISSTLQPSRTSIKYGLFPAWVLSVPYKKSDALLIINGHTGKVASRLPANKLARWKNFALLFLTISTLLLLIEWVFLLF